MTKELNELKGQVLAMSLTLNAVISALSRMSAGHAAVGLQIHREALLVQDAKDGASLDEVRARDVALDEYINKLTAVVKSPP